MSCLPAREGRDSRGGLVGRSATLMVMAEMTELLQTARAGDAAALGRLLQRYSRYLVEKPLRL